MELAPIGSATVPTMASTRSSRMPAEWTPHERCLMAWPTRPELWHGQYEAATAEYAAVAQAIARFEPVLMVAAPGWATTPASGADRMWRSSSCRSTTPGCATPGRSSSWFRRRPDRIDFRFNAWGERSFPYADDDRFPERILAHLGIPRHPVEMVLEGGSITVDGEGTLITTEQCLLNPNRNPQLVAEQIEDTLRQALGVEVIIWLPFGLAEDSFTDGHVDGVCAFVRPGAVLLQTARGPIRPNWDRLAANRRVLEQSRDAAGRQLEILEMPYLAHAEVGGRRAGAFRQFLCRQRRRRGPHRRSVDRRRDAGADRGRLFGPRSRPSAGSRDRFRRRRRPLHHAAGASESSQDLIIRS